MPATTNQVPMLQHTSKDSKTASNNQLNTNTGVKTLEQPDYVKQAQQIIEKKVRNLDKRRMKLEEYQEIQKKGQQLNEDQLLAVSKYGEVKASIELAKEMDTQLVALANDTMKVLKKQAKKEQIEREEQLKEKLKEVQKIHALLNTFGNEEIRKDFLEGRNGASQMNKQEIELFDNFHKLACSTEFSKTVENDINESVDHLMNLVENKNKTILSTTYSELKKLFERVMTSSYWTYEPEQPKVQPPQEPEQQPEEEVQQQQQQVESQESEQKQNVNYQQNTSADDYVIVSSQEVENTQLEQQQQQLQAQNPDQRTFFTTLNTQENINQFLTENNDGINFLQDSQIPQQQHEVHYEQQEQQQQAVNSQEHHQQQFVSNNNQQQQQDEFTSANQGGNQYGFGKPRHYDNQNYQPRNNNGNGGGPRRPYNPSDNNERRGGGGGGRGGYQGGYQSNRGEFQSSRGDFQSNRGDYQGGSRGGPQGGRGGFRGNGNYRGSKPRGAPAAGGYRNNNQQPLEARSDNN